MRHKLTSLLSLTIGIACGGTRSCDSGRSCDIHCFSVSHIIVLQQLCDFGFARTVNHSRQELTDYVATR